MKKLTKKSTQIWKETLEFMEMKKRILLLRYLELHQRMDPNQWYRRLVPPKQLLKNKKPLKKLKLRLRNQSQSSVGKKQRESIPISLSWTKVNSFSSISNSKDTTKKAMQDMPSLKTKSSLRSETKAKTEFIKFVKLCKIKLLSKTVVFNSWPISLFSNFKRKKRMNHGTALVSMSTSSTLNLMANKLN